MRFNLEEFKEEQIRLARKIITKDDFEEINLIAGVDQAFFENKIISAIAVCEYPSMKLIEEKYAVVEAKIPYIPGYLGFRESPAVLDAFTQLENRPHLLIVDGHGIAHPRKFGIASQLGLMLDIPTIGIAKKLLVGEIKDDKVYVEDELRGRLVKTREHANPLIVSVGHRISLKTAMEIIEKSTIPPHKLPEPLHIAHRYADKIREEEINKIQNKVKIN